VEGVVVKCHSSSTAPRLGDHLKIFRRNAYAEVFVLEALKWRAYEIDAILFGEPSVSYGRIENRVIG